MNYDRIVVPDQGVHDPHGLLARERAQDVDPGTVHAGDVVRGDAFVLGEEHGEFDPGGDAEVGLRRLQDGFAGGRDPLAVPHNFQLCRGKFTT